MACVLALQAIVTLALGAILATWVDEEYTLATTARGVAYAFHRAIDYELQAPLYFVLVAALRGISHAVLFARAISIVFALGFVYAMAHVARAVAPRTPTWIFAAVVAVNPFTIFAALEVRLYALALLLCALAWLAFDRGFFSGDDRRARLAFVGIAIVSLYTQYFIGIELAAFAVGLVVLGRWRALRDYLVAGALAGLAFVPMLVVLRAQVGGAFSVPYARPGVAGSLLIHPLLDFVFPIAYEVVFPGPTRALAIAGFGLALVAVFCGRPRFSRRVAASIAIAASVEAVYLVLAYGLHYELFVPRHFVALFVPEAVAAYAVANGFTSVRARACALALVTILSLGAVASDAVIYRALAKHGDWQRVGAYLSAHARPDDTIAIYVADAMPAFDRYYTGRAKVVPFPRPLDPDRYDVDAFFAHSEREAATALAHLPRRGHAWLVLFAPCNEFDPYGCREVAAALAHHARILDRVPFFENTVLRLEPTP